MVATVEAIRSFAEQAAESSVTVGQLPAQGGIVMQVVTGYGEFVSLSRVNQRRVLTVSFLSKYKEQDKAISTLHRIGTALSRATEFPADNIISAEVKADSGYVGKDGDYWLYSMTVAVRISI